MSKFKIGEMAYVKPDTDDSTLREYINKPLTIIEVSYCGYKFKEIEHTILGKELNKPSIWRENQLNILFNE